MGAWIEINLALAHESSLKVAPYMGAWIEIRRNQEVRKETWSLPTWGRGLKSKTKNGKPIIKGRSLHGGVD